MALRFVPLGIPELLLCGALLAAVPARSLWRSWAARNRPETADVGSKYLASTVEPLALLAVLATIWLMRNRSSSLLGLEWPIPFRGMVGIGVAIVLLSALGLATAFQKPVDSSSAVEAGKGILPQTQAELWPFVLFSLSVGVSWEILYRGYLLWALAPAASIGGAIAVSGLAYALAHGYRNLTSLLGSLAAALAFGAAYAATSSLWWLILLHAGLPLVAAFAVKSSYRSAAAQ